MTENEVHISLDEFRKLWPKVEYTERYKLKNPDAIGVWQNKEVVVIDFRREEIKRLLELWKKINGTSGS